MTREHFSLRVAKPERRLLEEQADHLRVSESALARRYIAEGIRRDRHPAVTFRVGRVGGRPALERRPRLEVATIVETWRDSDRDEAAAARYHDITGEEVKTALDYYAEFKDEIDAILAEKSRLADQYEKIAQARRTIV